MSGIAGSSSEIRGAPPRIARIAVVAVVGLIALGAAVLAVAAREAGSDADRGSRATGYGRVEQTNASGVPPSAPAGSAAAASVPIATPRAPVVVDGPVLYVDPLRGGDGASGAAQAPLRTIRRALELAMAGTTVRLLDGIYSEAVVTVRAGEPGRPIVIESAPGSRAAIDGGGGKLDAPRLAHSHVVLRGLEIRNAREGVRIERAEGVVLADNYIHHIDNECVRLHFSARNNYVERNHIHHCGLRSNGEGIYVGTAPEQRAKNGGQPDASTGNTIAANEVHDVEEGIDVKEDSSGTVVTGNVVYRSTDPNSGGINVRGDSNVIRGNRSYGNAGAGFRLGGDVADSPLYGARHAYGTANVLADNVAERNAGYGYKFMRGPQQASCSNVGQQNGGRLYYFNEGVAPFLACP